MSGEFASSTGSANHLKRERSIAALLACVARGDAGDDDFPPCAARQSFRLTVEEPDDGDADRAEAGKSDAQGRGHLRENQNGRVGAAASDAKSMLQVANSGIPELKRSNDEKRAKPHCRPSDPKALASADLARFRRSDQAGIDCSLGFAAPAPPAALLRCAKRLNWWYTAGSRPPAGLDAGHDFC